MKATRAALQKVLNKSKFIRHYGFQVARVGRDSCTLELPHKPLLERPGGIVNGRP